MLKIDHLTVKAKHFHWLKKTKNRLLLNDVSLEIKQGELVALVGESGSGKSILLQSILGLLPKNMCNGGDIFLNKNKLTEKNKKQFRGNSLCYIPQGVSALNPLIKIGPQLQRIGNLIGHYVKIDDIASSLKEFDLSNDTIDLYPNQLSGGMAKRVLACGANLTKADYILADEISSWLDDERAVQLLEYLKLLSLKGKGILWVTHDLLLATNFADRIAFLRNGSIDEILDSKILKKGGGSYFVKTLWKALPEHEFING